MGVETQGVCRQILTLLQTPTATFNSSELLRLAEPRSPVCKMVRIAVSGSALPQNFL